MDAASTDRPRREKSVRLMAMGISFVVLAAATMRAAGMSSELWFDEIYSLRLVEPLKTLGQVLWARHHDNKHHLIWLWMWFLGPDHSGWIYRLPSLLAGIAVLPVIFWVARRSMGSIVAWLTLLLAAFCYPLIMYSSEARGYSLAVLFAVCAFALAPGGGSAESAAVAVAFGGCIVLGFLSHLTFVYVYAGLLVWGALDLIARPRWLPLLYHGPAALALLLIYKFDVSKIEFGGGPPTSAADVLRWTTCLMFGTPVDGWIPIIVALCAAALAVAGLTVLARRHGPAQAAFFVTALIVAPILLTATRRNPFLATRYYLVCLPFLIFLMAIALAVIARGKTGRWTVLLLMIWLIANGLFRSCRLAVLGRGHVRQCLLYMAANSRSLPITYSSERPFMDRFSVGYYSTVLPAGATIVESTTAPPQWWILDLDDPFEQGPPTIRRNGHAYHLDSIYPSDVISGLTWDLYRLND